MGSKRNAAKATRLRWIPLILLVPLALQVGSCRIETTPVVAVTAEISAEHGGEVVHPRGATLTIPPRGLSQSTVVTIVDEGVPKVDPYEPMVPVSRSFSIDLGGAEPIGDLVFSLFYRDPQIPSGALEEAALILVSRTTEGVRRIRPVTADPGRSLHAAARLKDDLAMASGVAPSFEVWYVPPALGAWNPETVLQAPYYSQDGLAWCEPTSIAMLYNFHLWSPDVPRSNWGVAGSAKMDRNVSGAPPDGVLNKSGAMGLYVGQYWDADLIPSAPLTRYLQAIIRGWEMVELFGGGQYAPVNKVDPRPVQTTSESSPGNPGWTLHGYLIVGANESGLYIHDSSGALTGTPGIATFMTWDDYRETIAKDGEMDAWTAHLTIPVRPEPSRRGSIVLLGGGSETIVYESIPGNSDTYSRWRWDGDPYDVGYYWSFADGPFTPDAEFGSAFRLLIDGGTLAGQLVLRPRVANVTIFERTYTLAFLLQSPTGEFIVEQQSGPIRVDPRSWQANLVDFEVDMTIVNNPGIYRLWFHLYENGVPQDTKVVMFRVVE